MSVFDLMAKAGEISELIDKHKGMLDDVPAVLAQWTEFFGETAINSRDAAEGVARLEIEVRAVRNFLEPGRLSLELIKESMANAPLDPRNQNGEYFNG